MLAGCYQPAAYDACTISCETGACPLGFACDDNALCKPENMPGNCTEIAPGDAATDAPLTSSAVCFGSPTSFFRACVDPKPTVAKTFSGALTIDTEGECTLVQTQAGPPAVCVLAYEDITIEAGTELRAVGRRPLVLAAINSIVIAGGVDVASHGAEAGAGANTGGDCDAIAGAQSANTNAGGGGGAGGAHAQRGGEGGLGAGSTAGGAPTDGLGVARIRGGCRGSRGGKSAAGAGGDAGFGGGAIYFVANGTIHVADSALITASGGGGGAPGTRGGGGGGGAGGFIGLQAPTCTLGAAVRMLAIGGGGASGGGSSGSGNPGGEAVGPMATKLVTGPAGAGDGGIGELGAGGPGGPGTNGGGGGGGGGSGGVIGFDCENAPGTRPTIAPAPTSL